MINQSTLAACIPCRVEDKQLKAWYPLLDTRLFNVMGLSIDERTDKWQKYLEADEMPWNRYLIGKGWDNALVKELGINNVPRNLLLDANGVIVYEHVDIRQILLKIPGLAVKE